MTDQHPITPPQWQVDAWCSQALAMGADVDAVFLEAARWGWDQRNATVPAELRQAQDQELEACCEALQDSWYKSDVSTLADVLQELRAARRPKRLSLKEQALDRCNDYIDPDGIIRLALEQLDD
jgi:hypothetical protein